MRILVACEFSGRVREAFRLKGHEAFSCDILKPLDNSPFHIQDDVRNILTQNWDMMIAFPPCTYLTNANNMVEWTAEREQGRQEGIEFFKFLANSDIPKIAIENPVGVMSRHYKKPTQIIQPFEHGSKETKRTCLWLKNLPLLKPSKVIPFHERTFSGTSFVEWGYRKNMKKYDLPRNLARSLTFKGIANAMAEQWG